MEKAEETTMDRIQPGRWKRRSLYGVTVSVAVSALLGVIALLSGNFGDLQVKILLTTLTTSGASICALSCMTLWEGRGRKYPALPGVVLAIVAAVLVTLGIWMESEAEAYWKAAITLTLIAVATAHISLLSMARLRRGFAWSVSAAYLFTYALACMISFMLWAELSSDAHYRLVGVLSIAVVSLSIAIPVFHKLSASAPTTNSPTTTLTKMLCPNCTAPQSHPLGQATCPSCQTTFSITIIRPPE